MVHRFTQHIAGRSYEIDVLPVGARWRARLRLQPGTQTALMPFYGTTPAEAAERLVDWLTRAHARLTSVAERPATKARPPGRPALL